MAPSNPGVATPAWFHSTPSASCPRLTPSPRRPQLAPHATLHPHARSAAPAHQHGRRCLGAFEASHLRPRAAAEAAGAAMCVRSGQCKHNNYLLPAAAQHLDLPPLGAAQSPTACSAAESRHTCHIECIHELMYVGRLPAQAEPNNTRMRARREVCRAHTTHSGGAPSGVGNAMHMWAMQCILYSAHRQATGKGMTPTVPAVRAARRLQRRRGAEVPSPQPQSVQRFGAQARPGADPRAPCVGDDDRRQSLPGEAVRGGHCHGARSAPPRSIAGLKDEQAPKT